MTTWQLLKAACFLAFSVKVTNPFLRPLLEIQKCTSVEKSQCLCGFPLLSGCTSMPRSCTLSLILVHLYNNKNPSVYAGLRHCCTLSYSRPWGNGFCAVPRGGHTSPLFWSMGRRWLRPRTPVRSWGFTPNPTSFLKKT